MKHYVKIAYLEKGKSSIVIKPVQKVITQNGKIIYLSNNK